MAMPRGLTLALILSLSSLYLSTASTDGFLQCLWEKIPRELIFTQGSSGFTDVLVSSIRNPRFFTNTTVRPLCIVTPTEASHVQAAVLCGRMNGVRLRVRSGGHHYEGLSYRSERAEVFGVVDLTNLRAITVNANDGAPTAWGAIDVLTKWQDVAPTLPNEINIRAWGEKYFGANFQRLAAVKGAVDPTDYFRNEQSIPPLVQSN
ncbi:hypothetical protein EJB05_53267, partial [Eragrostis curvula]